MLLEVVVHDDNQDHETVAHQVEVGDGTIGVVTAAVTATALTAPGLPTAFRAKLSLGSRPLVGAKPAVAAESSTRRSCQ